MPKRIKSSHNVAKAAALRDITTTNKSIVSEYSRPTTEYSVFLHDCNGALVRAAVIM